MSGSQKPGRNNRLYPYLLAVAALAAALWYGHAHHSLDLVDPVQKIFPDAEGLRPHGSIYQVIDQKGDQLGWAGTGTASGYGGPLLIVVGIDSSGTVVGARVVEERETPIFWRMVRAETYLARISGSHYERVDFDYQEVAGVTGATRSAEAIVASLRRSVASVADGAFDVKLPLPRRPFEFGLLELTVLAILVAGLVAHRTGGKFRQRVRWVCQITGLIVIGFWHDSPITLSKLTAFGAGYFSDPRTSLALYLLIAGFLLTSAIFGRNIYCLYACPFGAAQRCVGVIGGWNVKLPSWLARTLEGARNVLVFALIFMAFLSLQPNLASYEPFAALFSLNGTTMQWLLLAVVLISSLAIHTPWCNHLCPMRTFEIAIQRIFQGKIGMSR